MTAKTTEAVDDYLKAILELSGPAAERVTSNSLAAPALGVVKPAIAQSDGGDALPTAFRHVAGETLFFLSLIHI